MTKITIGIVGSSWWADSMYLPALDTHPQADVVAVCGRNRDRAQRLADKWQIPLVFTDYKEMIDSGRVQAIIISTINDVHYEIAKYAVTRNVHTLCEKPLTLSYDTSQELANLANAKGVKHMVPFTYRFMPTARYLKALLDDGYIGRPYHLNMRYYASYARESGLYSWRFDTRKAGSGALGDIASHFLYLAYWYFGEVVEVSCRLGYMVERARVDPAGEPYPVGDDTAIIVMTFANGAQGVVHATTVGYENTAFGQTHHMEFHGSGGTLYHTIDWDNLQQVTGARAGEGKRQVLPVPDEYWGKARRDVVHDTYKDMFRVEPHMTRAFITGIAEDSAISPTFDDGAYIQCVIDAAVKSHEEKRWVALDEIRQESS